VPKAQIDEQPNGFLNQSTNWALTQACRSLSRLYGGKKHLGTQSKGTPGVSFWVGAKCVALAPFVSVSNLFEKDFEKERSALRVVLVLTQNKALDHYGLWRRENDFKEKRYKGCERGENLYAGSPLFHFPSISDLARNLFERK